MRVTVDRAHRRNGTRHRRGGTRRDGRSHFAPPLNHSSVPRAHQLERRAGGFDGLWLPGKRTSGRVQSRSAIAAMAAKIAPTWVACSAKMAPERRGRFLRPAALRAGRIERTDGGRGLTSASELGGFGGAAMARSNARPAGPGSSSLLICARARSTSSIDSKIGSSNVACESSRRSSGGASFPIEHRPQQAADLNDQRIAAGLPRQQLDFTLVADLNGARVEQDRRVRRIVLSDRGRSAGSQPRLRATRDRRCAR